MATMIVVCGVPGVGKTTVARRIAEQLDVPLYRTDDYRQRLFGTPEYTDDESRELYYAMVAGAAARARDGMVVLDGTFSKHYQRRLVRDRAERTVVVNVLAPEDRVRKNLRARPAYDESEADFDVYEHVMDTYEPLQQTDYVVFNDGEFYGLMNRADDVAERLT